MKPESGLPFIPLSYFLAFAAASSLMAMLLLYMIDFMNDRTMHLYFAVMVWVSLSGVLHGFFNGNRATVLSFVGVTAVALLVLLATIDVQLIETQWTAYFSNGDRVMGDHLFEMLAALLAAAIQAALLFRMALTTKLD